MYFDYKDEVNSSCKCIFITQFFGIQFDWLNKKWNNYSSIAHDKPEPAHSTGVGKFGQRRYNWRQFVTLAFISMPTWAWELTFSDWE